MNDVDYLVNDLSLHGQFHDMADFIKSIDVLMAIREEISRLGSALYCHRGLVQAQVMPDIHMQKAVQGLDPNKRRALMSWLANIGPYWEDARLHTASDYLAVEEDIVTDTAIGEAAICISRKLARELVGFSPSRWMDTPIGVDWVREEGDPLCIDVPNHWTLASVKASLQANPIAFDSWASLEAHLRQSCTRLTFSDDAFAPLHGHPFALAPSIRIRVLLHILNDLKGCFGEDGLWNAEGRQILADYFSGEN